MFGAFVFYIYDFIYLTFSACFEDIFLDYTDEATLPMIKSNYYEGSLIDYAMQIISCIITILIIGLFIYLVYRLIMFIVRRVVNV